ncbi:MAG TPA: hypothetical protein ENF73_00540 [Proteobacteria bacterium]|nr:hypothetical protein [Pseudomonadota bacterium]
MKRMYKRWYFWAFVVLIVVWLLVQTFFPPAYARVKQLMKVGARAIEREDVKKVMKLLHPEFRTGADIDAGSVELVLERLFRKYERIRVELEKMRVIVEGDEARVYFSAWVEGTIAATMMSDKPVREVDAVEEARAVWHKTEDWVKLINLDYVGLEEGL